MRQKILSFSYLFIIGFSLIIFSQLYPVAAQIPTFSNLINQPRLISQTTGDKITSDCIRLDGRCLFSIYGNKKDLEGRLAEIQTRFAQVSRFYLKNKNSELDFRLQEKEDDTDIYINPGNGETFLLTVTKEDANLLGLTPEKRAKQIQASISLGLRQAREERSPSFLIQQTIIAIITLAITVILYLFLRHKRKELIKVTTDLIASAENLPFKIQLSQKQKSNLKEIQSRLLQLIQALVLLGGLLFILGLYPQTRPWQVVLINLLRIPLRLFLVAIITYLLIRCSYFLIAKISSILAEDIVESFTVNQRLKLRIETISTVTKSIVTILLIILGIIVGLSLIDIDVAPLLAGAGIIGLAVSFASQSLIKDTINGFFIILEDQYAVGDVVAIGDFSGLVENINLRITQLRDGEGRLITIPNSEIKIVANSSSGWSRSDLFIPIPYEADIDQAINLIKGVAEAMRQDLTWCENILEPAQILGVEQFSDRGLIIRVWIKTKTLKQWEVAREFRRRLKIAFDQAGIPLPLPQHKVWLSH